MPSDDISNTEAADSLGLGHEIDQLEESLGDAERRRRKAKKESEALKDKRLALREIMDHCDDEAENWESLQEKLEDGKTVYAPVPKSRKRKRGSSDADSDDSSDEIVISDDESQDRGQPLTAEEIESKIHELKNKKKDARRERNDIEAQLKDFGSRMKEINTEINEIEARRSQLCIAARNEYSKSAIQNDFAAGIKEVCDSVSQNAQIKTDLFSSLIKKPKRQIIPMNSILKTMSETTNKSQAICLFIVCPVGHIRSSLVDWSRIMPSVVLLRSERLE